MKVAIAQLAPVVGAFEHNVALIESAYLKAEKVGARLLVTPELCLPGYPPHDLIERPEIFIRCEEALTKLAQATKGKVCALAVGHISKNESGHGRLAQNSVSVFENGRVVFTQAKTLLPTYDVFDESRYFEPSGKIVLWECDGERVAFAICEDLWGKDESISHLYSVDPVSEYARLKATLVISLSASPYEWGKQERRIKLHEDVAKKLNVPVVYVNQIGATDEIIFDGRSFVTRGSGAFAGELPAFEPSFGIWDGSALSGVVSAQQAPNDIQGLRLALVMGVREYFSRTGFKKAILGLSGGIDSSVVAALAVQALGRENVIGVAMPSMVSSGHSLADAETLARALEIRFEVQPIKFINSAVARQLGENRGGKLADLALENLQARLRGLFLMTLANHENALVFATSNKSELATGFSTQYGDLIGAIAPLGDLVKGRVYALGRELNAVMGVVIPESVFTKAPSAELRPDQTDQDTLPPYDELDLFVQEYIENRKSIAEISKLPRFKGAVWLSSVASRVEMNEYKRRQSPPVLKVTSKAFGIGRRIPIAKQWL